MKPSDQSALNRPDSEPSEKARRVRMGRYSMPVPASKTLRITLGISLCVGGAFGFLPILGYWMIPLGLIVLSIDFHPVRRFRRRFEVHWGRRSKERGQR